MLTLLYAAAELRAATKSWEAVAEAPRRKPETCRHWPVLYRSAWRRCFRLAVQLRHLEAGCEAREFLRTFLRADNKKLVLAAAQLLLPRTSAPTPRRSLKANPAAPDQEFQDFIAELQELTHEQAARKLQEHLAKRQAEDGADAPPGA
jgi:hypothetical protein